ncbi:hypothetical protein FQA39_LY14346 [Lamprigera yunnana]|nr:hypothetical protein FQA39_LY14346 [Lamprigera yunnana]
MQVQPRHVWLNAEVLGYYWKDFFGTIPTHAAPGGQDEEGDITYIGQVWIADGYTVPWMFQDPHFGTGVALNIPHWLSVDRPTEMFSIVLLVLLGIFGSGAFGASPCGVKCGCYTNSTHVLGYYWKEFFGSIPFDAVPGGYDEEGATTYIGQVYMQEYGLLTGTLYRGCSKIHTSAYDKDIIHDRNIKILCSNVQNRLKWMPTKKGEHYKLSNCHLVIGGTETDLIEVIGRIYYNGQAIVGKVFRDDAKSSGLWIPGVNSGFPNYEVLTYNC